MADEIARVAHADWQVAAAKERVGRQRQLIARLDANGHSVRDAESFLSALMNVLSAFERHRLLILKRLDEP